MLEMSELKSPGLVQLLVKTALPPPTSERILRGDFDFNHKGRHKSVPQVKSSGHVW